MKFLHISDLHIGKRVNGFSMLEDQKFILNSIEGIIKEEKPDAVLIAGDVYDKPVASAEAVSVFDAFLTGISSEGGPDIFIISGNHDSGERLAFGSGIMDKERVYISGVYDGSVRKVDYDGENTTVHLLPFVRPAEVRTQFPEAVIADYNDALRTITEQMEVDTSRVNIILAHQFITGGLTSDSEESSVGGLDNVDAKVFDSFDYVALGHLHGPQNMGREGLRYAGSPLKYSFSEVGQKKSVTVLEAGKDGADGSKPGVTIREIPLKPLRDMRVLKGSYDDLMSLEAREKGGNDDYLKVVLTDEENIPYVMDKMRQVYPNIMALEYENMRSRDAGADMFEPGADRKALSPLELFGEFYRRQNNAEMNEEKRDFIRDLIEEVWEGEK